MRSSVVLEDVDCWGPLCVVLETVAQCQQGLAYKSALGGRECRW